MNSKPVKKVGSEKPMNASVVATGSTSPYWWRSAWATSRGTLGLAASSSNGSPGASARIVNRTRLIPASTGTAMRSRRMKYLVRLPLAVPVLEVPEVRVPAALLGALEAVRDGGDRRPQHDRDDHDVLDDEVVHLDEERRALDGIQLALRGTEELVVLLVAPARDVAPLPLVVLGRDLPRRELVHERLGIGLRHGGRLHLEVGIEVRVGVGVGHVRGEVDGGHHALELHLDPRLGRRLLDDDLRLLAQRVVGRLVDHLQLDAVLGPDAVGALLPAARLEDLVGLVDVELVLGVLREELLRLVEEVRGRDAGTPVDLLLYRGPIHQEVQRLADGGVGEERMLGLEAGALAVDVLPRVGVVELDVLDVAAGHDVGLALAALLHALEVLVLDLEVPGEVVLAGLDDGAGRRVGVAAALHLDGVEVRAVGHVIGRVQLALDHVARLEIHEAIGPGADRLEVGRRLARLVALELAEQMLGEDHAAHADE